VPDQTQCFLITGEAQNFLLILFHCVSLRFTNPVSNLSRNVNDCSKSKAHCSSSWFFSRLHSNASANQSYFLSYMHILLVFMSVVFFVFINTSFWYVVWYHQTDMDMQYAKQSRFWWKIKIKHLKTTEQQKKNSFNRKFNKTNLAYPRRKLFGDCERLPQLGCASNVACCAWKNLFQMQHKPKRIKPDAEHINIYCYSLDLHFVKDKKIFHKFA
jgi:hypothetical protein